MSSIAITGASSSERDARIWIAIALGASVWLGTLAWEPTDAWAGLLTASLFGFGISLGALVFLAIQIVTGARWWVSLHPVPRRLIRALPVPSAALVVCLLGGLEVLYPWARPGAMEASPLLAGKAVWLNAPLFLVRAGIVLIVWLSFATAIEHRLTSALAAGSPAAVKRLSRAAILFLICFAFSSSVAFWDWSMSLEPEWFSTMRGVYGFAGVFLSGIAAVTVVAVKLDFQRRLPTPLSADQRHDLGRFLFAFSVFWAYIWFCEYLLIWYANLPEETGHYLKRLGGGWSMLFWLNSIVSFFVPFFALLSAGAKRQAAVLYQVGVIVLAGRWLDCHLLVAPSLFESPRAPVAALAATVVVLAVMLLVGRRDRLTSDVSSS